MKKFIFALSLSILAVLTWVHPNALLPLRAETTYNLTYELFGGANHAGNPSSYTDAQSNFALLPASKPGLVFQGWYKSEGFREVDRVEVLPGSHGGITKLYAKYGVLNFTVDFVSNGGNAIEQKESIPTFSQSPNPTFVGGSESSSGYTSVSRDINGDGKGDFITFVGGDRHIFTSHPTLGFSYSRVNNNLINFAWGSKFYDINDDDLEDLIVIADNGVMTYSLRQPDLSLGVETAFTFQPGGVSYNSTTAFDMADFDQDGDLDIVIIGNGILVYCLNEGNYTFGPAVQLTTFSGYGRGVTLYDLTNDGHLDVVFSNSGSTFVKWGNGVTPFGGSVINLSIGPYRPFISDVNRDGNYEVIGLESNRRVPLYVSFNNNLTANFFSTFPGANDILGAVNWVGDEMDANGDGYADLFYFQGQTESGMLISRGDGTYYIQRFTLQDASNSGTVVFDPGFGSLGVMGVGLSNLMTRYYTITGNQSVSHLASIAPTREGYTFAGWYEQSDLSGSPFNFSAGINENKTLYAKWELNQYNIVYSMNGGTNNPNNPQSLNIEMAAITLQEPTKPGSRFLGWYDNANFTGSPITTIPANQSTEFYVYAKWLDPVTVSFNSNGGSSVPSIVNLPGEPLVQPADPTRNGYTFLGWFEDSGFTTPYVFTTVPNQNKTIYAKWSAMTFTVTFETNGGTALAPVDRNTDQSLSLPTPPTKVGHTFEGWYTNQALTTRLTVTKMPPNNLTLYAKWTVNIHRLQWTIEDQVYSSQVAYDTTLSTVLPTPTKYQHEFLGWSLDGETVTTLPSKMPDNPLTLIALFRDNVDPVVFTLTDGDTYAGGVDIIFNEGTALLNGQPVQSGYRVEQAGTYTLILTDEGGNVVEVTFTVIAAVDNSTTRWIIFAVILAATWLFLTVLYFLNRKPSVGGSGGGTLVMNTPAPKPKPVVKTKKKVAPTKPVEKPAPVKTVAPATPTPPAQPVTPQPKVQDLPKPEPAKTVEVKKSVPKVEVKKPVEKVPPMPEVKPEVIDQQLTETVIFSKPLKIKVDPAESFKPEVKAEFDNVFVSDKRAVKVPELTYVPQTTNVPFYTNLFRYIHRFAGVLTEGLLGTLTQSVIKLTDDKEAQLKIVEASTRTAEGLKTNQNQDYLLKILRRNVALNRDVLNPRNKYVYSYQRLATLLEEMGIYLEAVILVREAYERGLVDTPDATFEKRLTRLEKKLVDSGGQRQDMIRK